MADDLRSLRRFVFASGLFLLLLFEFAQALYAIVPIAFLLAFEIVLVVPRRRAAIAAWAKRAAATFVVPFVAAAAVLAALGSLGPTPSFIPEGIRSGSLRALHHCSKTSAKEAAPIPRNPQRSAPRRKTEPAGA